LVVVVAGTVGYLLLGLSIVDALYMVVISISTAGYKEVGEFGTAERLFTMALLLTGVGAALYTFTVTLEALVEGTITQTFGRRRMGRRIDSMDGHVVVCGWGRVGTAVASEIRARRHDVVLIDIDSDRLQEADCPHIVGDATQDSVLRAAGVERARVLVAALTTDADNLFVTLSAKAVNPSIFVIARARMTGSDDKLLRAGADRVVNPQEIGGARMAAFALQPNVAEFLDVVVHERGFDLRLEEVVVPALSPLAGQTLRDSHLRDRTGALVLAVRGSPVGDFTTNPHPETVLEPGAVLIAIGTPAQLAAMGEALTGSVAPS
jgi:voltage-gated potassium channel